jgi:predicted GTPase
MATFKSHVKDQESGEDLELDDEISQDDINVKVNIAICGKTRSGRSTFVNAVRG